MKARCCMARFAFSDVSGDDGDGDDGDDGDGLDSSPHPAQPAMPKNEPATSTRLARK